MPNACQANGKPSQNWNSSHTAFNGGRNDGFVRASGPVAMGYWTADTIPFYYDLARTFPLCDRWFASCLGQTYPNRRFLLAGTAYGLISTDAKGILAPSPANGTIFDQLNAHGIAWRDYYTDLPSAGLFKSVVDADRAKLLPIAQFTADAAAGALPAVSLVEPNFSKASEENPQDIQTGEFFSQLVIQAVLHGAAWDKTLMLFTYDEHGGYYDHVPPVPLAPPDGIRPNVPGDETYGDMFSWSGFRVPGIVISPWSRPDYVSHVVHDHTSFLRLIETKWNLPALTARDANASNLLDCVDFTRPSFEAPPHLAAATLPTGELSCYLQDPTLPV
jgi:phospholipase C